MLLSVISRALAMIGAGSRAGVPPGPAPGLSIRSRMEAVMRIRRNILAPAILTIGTIGSLVAGPVLALTTAAAPVGGAVAVHVAPNMTLYHG